MNKLVELFRYRELVRNLVVRDLKVRYRNSVLGFLWAWGNPLLMTAVFTTVFKILLQSQIHKFPLFILVAFLAWNFCTASITGSILSVVDNANIIKKVYFPRETLPISVVFANLANFLLALPLVFALMMWYRLPFTPFLLYLPLIVAIQVIFLLGVALILSCINVFLRDTEVIADVLLTAWFFLTPVFYPIEFLPQDWHGFNLHRLMYILNPMASIIASYRSILYGSYDGGPPAPPDLAFLMRTLVTSAAILVIGYIVFIRYSRLFGEEL